MKPVKSYSNGLSFLMDGYKVIIKDPGLRRLSVFPFLICLICFFVGLGWGGQQIPRLVESVMTAIFGAAVEGWWSYVIGMVKWLFQLLTYFLYIGLVLYLTFLAASVIASPFNSLIAERVLVKEGILEDRPFNMKRWMKVSFRMVWIALLRAIVLGLFAPILFLSSFVPGLNILAGFAVFLLLAFDVTDFSLEALEKGLRERFGYIKQNFYEFSGMASVLALTAFVPGLTVLVMPISVAGAAQVVAKIEKQKQASNT